jgi:hypothetical protein
VGRPLHRTSNPGQQLAPWLADRYLAKTAINGQQVADMPVAADRPDNLFEPRPEQAATHGIFNDRAKTRSPQLWAATHRPALAAAIGAIGAVATTIARSRR